MNNDYIFALILGLLIVLGLASTRLVKVLKLPNVTGFLVIGIIIALSCIGIDYATNSQLHLTDELNHLNTSISGIALGFIALSIGEEFKVSKIKKYGGKIITITFFQALCACLFVDGAVILTCYLLNLPIYIGIILGAIATATAPAATVMVINQYKAKGPLVDLLLPVVAFDDAIGLIVFAISISVSKTMATGASLSAVSLLAIPLLNIFGSLLIGFILGILLKYTINFFKSRNNHLMMLISFTLIATGICAVINATCKINNESLEFSNLLCCMMVGATYINTKHHDKEIIERDFNLVDRWTPFLFLLFFVLSGCHLITSAKDLLSGDLKNIYPTLIIFAVYLVSRTLGKYCGAALGCKITKQDKNNTKYLGITLLPQAGVAIGMANVVSNIPEFNSGTFKAGPIIVTVVLCATLIYELLGPLTTKWALIKAGEIENKVNETPYEDSGATSLTSSNELNNSNTSDDSNLVK